MNTDIETPKKPSRAVEKGYRWVNVGETLLDTDEFRWVPGGEWARTKTNGHKRNHAHRFYRRKVSTK